MPAVDLSQLPEPAIIAEPDFEAILADTKAMMIASSRLRRAGAGIGTP